jgi:flagellar hook assembly protein FlgD
MFYLAQNYPNPFNPETTVEFALPKPSHVKLQIYNLLGQPIRTLIDEKIDAGFNSIKWEGRDDGGRQMPSGVYLYQMRAGSFVATRKLVLMR